MEFEKYLPSLLTLGGSLLTGVFALLGVWLANRSSLRQLALKLDHEKERENKETIRIRMEELYALFDGWAGYFVAHHITYRRVMDGLITYNDAMDISLKSKPAKDVRRMLALADIYFPNARAAFNEVMNLRDQANEVQSEFREKYRINGDISKQHSIAITEILKKFDVAVNEYKSELLAYAPEI